MVIEIVREYLIQHGYDGLCDDDCGCEIDDLAPVLPRIRRVVCAWLQDTPCDPEECPFDGDCDFHISELKPEEKP